MYKTCLLSGNEVLEKITLKTSLGQFLFELNLTSVRVVVHITQEEKVDEGLISFG